MLWYHWWNLVCDLRSACARTRTFLWMALCLAGMATRKELLGGASIVRVLGLEPACYDRLLDFFHSPALNLNKLTHAWCALVFRAHPGILRVNGRPVLVGDGIKVNAICPGNFLDGPLWSDPDNGLFVQYLRQGKVPGAKTIEDVRGFYEAKVPMGRGCTPADVLEALYYVVAQRYETGQAIPVTGGQVMLK